jgi:aminopeptidase N
LLSAQEVPTIPADSKELRPHRLAVGLYDLANGKLQRRNSVELDITGSATPVKELVGEKVADLLLLNDHDITYAKIRLDERSIATLSQHLGDISDPLSRALVWSSLWDSLRDGELAAHVYVPTALRALRNEPEIAVILTTLLQLDTAVEMFASDKNRDRLRTEVATAIEEMMNAAVPGSDARLQFARGFASAASTSAQGARIKELLDGKLAGLTIDADLRWHLIGCLVERSLMTKVHVEAELARDNTAHGQRAAAYAIAAIPTAQSKADAFAIAVEGKVSNTIHAATIRGFQRPSHRDLLAEYVDPYFAKVADVWEKQPFELAKTTATLLYPSWVITEETVTKSENWLNGPGKACPCPLRRSVAEGRDGIVRALKAQIKDSE